MSGGGIAALRGLPPPFLLVGPLLPAPLLFLQVPPQVFLEPRDQWSRPTSPSTRLPRWQGGSPSGAMWAGPVAPGAQAEWGMGAGKPALGRAGWWGEPAPSPESGVDALQ